MLAPLSIERVANALTFSIVLFAGLALAMLNGGRDAEAAPSRTPTPIAPSAPLDSRRVELANLRKWRVKDFEDVLIFYLPHSRGITVVRVLHAARNRWDLLGLV